MKTTSPRYMILRLMGKDAWRGWNGRKPPYHSAMYIEEYVWKYRESKWTHRKK